MSAAAEFVCHDCTMGSHQTCDIARGLLNPRCHCTDAAHRLFPRLLITTIPEENGLRFEVTGVSHLGITVVSPKEMLSEYLLAPGVVFTLTFSKKGELK